MYVGLFKLVSKTFHIHLHEETDVKFLGCIDNQIFFAMKLRHLDPPHAPPPLWCRVWRRMTFQTIRYEVLRFGTRRSGVIVRCSCYGADRGVLRRGLTASFCVVVYSSKNPRESIAQSLSLNDHTVKFIHRLKS